MHPPSDAELVAGALAGGQASWDALVERFTGLVWSIARAHRLGGADAADVSQTVWLRLVESLGRIRDPERVGGWLAATTRNECLRVLRQSGRQLPTDLETDTDAAVTDDPAPDAGLLADERHHALWRAFATISDRCRRLLRVLLADPPPSYESVSAALAMPVGSIGPTRARCLEQLRARPGISDLL